MCGIGGFSLSADSKIKPRQLANALLTALEDRGYMASGAAWQAPDGAQGFTKGAVPGSGLPLKLMPKNANTVIVHTRLATHGSVHDNRNNHPVISPNKSVALVHNGVIYNHSYVRDVLPPIDFDVDTAVIPALIEDDPSLSRLTELDGDAAIAWLQDDRRGVLNVARLEHSPLCIAQLEDGSFIFASTESLLWRVLIQLDLMPSFMQNVPEYKMMRVQNGVITDYYDLPKSTAPRYGSYDYSGYRHLTAGAKGSTSRPKTWMDAMWDDEYDDWDDVTPLSMSSLDSSYGATEKSPADSYYIQYLSSFSGSPHYLYYEKDEYKLYENDLWNMTYDEREYDVIDYGYVDKNGILISENI